MNYYFVWVRSNRYHGNTPLTYSFSGRLGVGSVVQVELQNQLVMGVISAIADKPKFKTKPIAKVLDLPTLPKHLLRLSSWLLQYYPAPIGILSQSLLPATMSDKRIAGYTANSFEAPDLSGLPALTSQQKLALKTMDKRDSYVLHGITGSGKTRLYIDMAVKAIASGNSAIILTPEISLTSQLANNFRRVFGERVVVIHSNLTPSDRQKAWLKIIKSDDPLIVIGPRSALFMPLKDIGLIVLDESHESAYKQEQAPQYQTGRVAAYLAQAARASLVLGSATPAVADYYLAKEKSKPIVVLDKLAQTSDHKPTNVTVVDRKDYSLFTRSQILSTELIKAIELALNNQEQTLLYLNRRGTARMIMCEKCGWQATCPHCDVPLTYHADNHHLRCHSCTYNAKAPGNCPDCGHHEIIYKTAGTKAVVSEVEKLFPNARVARFDTDNSLGDSFERNYEQVKNGEVDIIIGTQLLAKGLDLPKLSTLGVLLADASLYMPDYTAEERTFQLINQVLGRVGRGHVAGRAIIQTYNPEHPVIIDAINSNYQNFYEREIFQRRQYLFPPFCFLMKITFRRASAKSAEESANKLKNQIKSEAFSVNVEGPAPCFYERFNGKFQWQIIIKAKDRSELLKIIKILPANLSYDIDPIDIL